VLFRTCGLICHKCGRTGVRCLLTTPPTETATHGPAFGVLSTSRAALKPAATARGLPIASVRRAPRSPHPTRKTTTTGRSRPVGPWAKLVLRFVTPHHGCRATHPGSPCRTGVEWSLNHDLRRTTRKPGLQPDGISKQQRDRVGPAPPRPAGNRTPLTCELCSSVPRLQYGFRVFCAHYLAWRSLAPTATSPDGARHAAVRPPG